MPDPLLVNQKDAAAMLDMNVKTFVRHVRPEIKRIDLGRKFAFPVTELERWVAERSTSL